jgi:hypothetical protein
MTPNFDDVVHAKNTDKDYFLHTNKQNRRSLFLDIIIDILNENISKLYRTAYM